MFLHKGFRVNFQTLAVATSITAGTIFILKWYKMKRKECIPDEWIPVGKVSQLFLYPIKSGRRLDLQTGECTTTGIKQIREPGKYRLGDRTLIVYKKSAKECRTARASPTLVLIEAVIDDNDNLILNAPGMEPLRLDILKLLAKSACDRREEIVMFYESEEFHIIDCGDEAADWVSKYLTGDGLSDSRLGIHDGTFKRTFGSLLKLFAQAYPLITHSSMGVYSDLCSYMLMNQSSLQDLVARLPNSNISVHNFRPNIVVSGENLLPFDEDKWTWVKIGDVIFKNIKACTRCILTTVDPETGTRNKNMEPLKTLRSYRCIAELLKADFEKDSPAMGTYLTLVVGGIINVGDTISVVREI